MVRKYARMLVYGHYLFVKAHCFLRASLSEKRLRLYYLFTT